MEPWLSDVIIGTEIGEWIGQRCPAQNGIYLQARAVQARNTRKVPRDMVKFQSTACIGYRAMSIYIRIRICLLGRYMCHQLSTHGDLVSAFETQQHNGCARKTCLRSGPISPPPPPAQSLILDQSTIEFPMPLELRFMG